VMRAAEESIMSSVQLLQPPALFLTAGCHINIPCENFAPHVIMPRQNSLTTCFLFIWILSVVGTPLSAMHFRVGDYVDVQAKT